MKKADNYAEKMKEMKSFVRRFVAKEIYCNFNDTDYMREYFRILTILHSLNGKKRRSRRNFSYLWDSKKIQLLMDI